MSEGFWSGKRVLLTGHTGFKGSWLCAVLSQKGAIVSGVALRADELSHFNLIRKRIDLEHHESDIRNFESLEKIVKEFKPQIVFHLAAQALVRDSYRDPLLTYSTNVMGTANLLSACQKIDSIKAIVVVTTDKCYENNEQIWGFRETDPLGGHDPYSNSKACAELVVSSYRKSFFTMSEMNNQVGLATARAGNVIGGGDWSRDRLIPDLMRSYHDRKVCRIRNPNSTRPWQHVIEPVFAYLKLAEQLFVQPKNFSKAYNFGPNEDSNCTVGEILEIARLNLVSEMTWEIDKGQHPHEARLLRLDCSLAKLELNWRPRWEVKQALQETFHWYKTFYTNPDRVVDLTFDQIAKYQALGS